MASRPARNMKKLLLILCMVALPSLASAQTIGPYAHNNTVTPPDSGYINNVALSANSAATITWPSGAAYVNISCASPPYYASLQSGIAVPASTITNGTGAALNPAQRQRSLNETAFYIISATAQECSFEYWGS
jgi:hypothetical protein